MVLLIDVPAVGEPLEVWDAFFEEMKGLDQSNPAVQRAVADAEVTKQQTIIIAQAKAEFLRRTGQ